MEHPNPFINSFLEELKKSVLQNLADEQNKILRKQGIALQFVYASAIKKSVTLFLN